MSAGDDWQGATFAPEAIRHFSLLPDQDADEAYCVRHDREMRQIDPVLHTDGALYTTTENFSVYSCPRCVEELSLRAGRPDGGAKAYQYALVQAFDQWDDGDAPGDWFQYLGEGSPEDATGGQP